MSVCGFCGKVPDYGDFVTRGLPTDFVKTWIEWLSRELAWSRETLRHEWAGAFKGMPVWQFVLATEVIGDQPWIGVICPSLDSAHRYFPFTIAMTVLSEASPVELIRTYAKWFEGARGIVLDSVLHDASDLDGLGQQVQAISATAYHDDSAGMNVMRNGSYVAASLEDIDELSSEFMLIRLLSQCTRFSSAWYTQGSDYVAASAMLCDSLPRRRAFDCLLRGTGVGIRC